MFAGDGFQVRFLYFTESKGIQKSGRRCGYSDVTVLERIPVVQAPGAQCQGKVGRSDVEVASIQSIAMNRVTEFLEVDTNLVGAPREREGEKEALRGVGGYAHEFGDRSFGAGPTDAHPRRFAFGKSERLVARGAGPRRFALDDCEIGFGDRSASE